MRFEPAVESKEQFKTALKSVQNRGTVVLISIGGANAPIELKTEALRAQFVSTMKTIIDEYGFDGLDIDLEGSSVILDSGDTDFQNPTTPKIVNLISALREIAEYYGPSFILTAAPETQYVQGGYGNYGGAFGGYLPVLHALRDLLDFVHVQYYNTGSQFAYTGVANPANDLILSQSTPDFVVAMTEMLIEGFPVARNSASFFPGLGAAKVAIGLPATPSAAPAGGYLTPARTLEALDYLVSGQSAYSNTYTLRNTAGHPHLRGIMTWSINWDKSTDGNTASYEFANSYGPYFDTLPTNPTTPDPTPTPTPSPTPSATPTPTPDPTPTPTPTPTPSETPDPITPVSDRVVAVYFPSWGIYQKGYRVADLPADKLTHIIHAFARISSAGEIQIIDTWADIEIPQGADTWDTPLRGNFGAYARLKAAYPHLRVLIAVGGWYDSGKFSDVAATVASRQKFAQSVRNFVVQYGFDGVDLDWEYPVVATDVNSNVRADDATNYAKLAAAIRAEFDAQSLLDGKYYEITAATPAGYDKFEKIDLRALSAQLDFFNLMTYDFHGRWNATLTGHNAPLFAAAKAPVVRYTADEAVRGYIAAGVPSEKIVLGVPAYGYGWTGVTDPTPFSAAAQTGPGTLAAEPGFYDYRTVANLVLQNPSAEKWDEAAQASYYYDGNLWIGYDSPRALRRKLNYVAEKNLGGVMFWEASTDIRTNSNPLQLLHIAGSEMP